jgi:hypothetical protein
VIVKEGGRRVKGSLLFALLLDLVAMLEPGTPAGSHRPFATKPIELRQPLAIFHHEQFPQLTSHTSSKETPFKKLSFIFDLTLASRKNIHSTFLGKDKPRDDDEANFLCYRV